GAGGGKAIDAARAAAAVAGCSFVSCPTIASTDSPCSALSVIYDEHGVYQGFDSFGMNPTLVLVDTAVIIDAPERYFVAGMGDALATVFEARACIQANQENLRGGFSTIAAREIAEACYQTIMNDGRQALEDLRSGIPTPAFERVVEANTLLSGIGFESAGLAAAHGIHNAMTVAPATHSCLHGEKVSFGVMVQLVLESQPDELIDSVSGFCVDVGLPITLAGVGLSSEDRDTLNLIVQAAIAPGSLIYNEPFEISAELLMDAILEANKRGEAASAQA
ncbi:MAG: glycerol dehydrogenase, partial [Phycisphaerales bacterium]|nr:glycerol dehydrogenase [Phycisphaerales bacterium]